MPLEVCITVCIIRTVTGLQGVELAALHGSDLPGEKRDLMVFLQDVQLSCVSAG